ncbi:hypothetical protein [Prescottella equi]|uniref:hypothetical protein n=1 Tax=Rhodococcus hoagii TaxID=43767 RepID=UPI000A0FFCD8|nr:hypothetical protein [Prescottella equi]ORM00687.1 hypothetical protein A5N69_07025 [Prescottella equi]ORM21573.1 hypothetical protein A5N74_01675 [Prescottella equi]
MSDFATWLADVARTRGLETEAEISRAVNISQSIVGRWRIQGTAPEIKSLRRVADGLGVSIQEALVAAGYVTPEEVGVVEVTPVVNMDVSRIPTAELLRELARRLGEADPAVKVSGS